MSVHPVQVIAVTGGKGGVGKSNVSLNLGMCLSELGRRVVLLDADLGLANLDILLGLTARENLSHVLSGQCSMRDILVEGPGGMKIVPASSGTKAMVELGPREHAGLIHAFSELSDDIDVLIIDTAAGISDMVLSFVTAAQETLFVVTNEPTSITDAYAMIKILNQNYDMYRFNVVANMVRSQQEGRDLYAKLTKVTDRFLDVALQFTGCIPFDEYVRKAIQRQKAVVEAYPRSKAALAYRTLANKVDAWPLPTSPRGHLEFFVDRLVQGAAVR
jgi:flagellar biosynthesis protein FlhG